MDRLITAYIHALSDSQDRVDGAIRDIVQVVNTEPSGGFLSLMQGLQCHLVSEQALVRSQATALVATTTSLVNQSSVSKETVVALVDFYCERLADQACVPEVLRGLYVLSLCDQFHEPVIVKACQAVLSFVNVQTYHHTARYQAFLFFDSVIRNHADCLQAISSDFVSGIIQNVDGEQDPNNLMLVFSLIKGIIQEFDIARHVEDLFEVTFCYFPITFTPQPFDPRIVTTEQLKAGLNECLSATPYFAKFALPLLLEKLSSNSILAKKDAMETITACCPSYGSSFMPYSEEIWTALRNEIFNESSDELAQIALKMLRAVTTELSMCVSIGGLEDAVEQFLKPIVAECIEYIQSPDLKHARMSGMVLMTCAVASDPACATVTLGVVPFLLSLYSSDIQTAHKHAILTVLIDLVEANRILYGTVGVISPEYDVDFVTPLLGYKNEFIELFTGAIMSNECRTLRLAGIHGVMGFIVLRKIITEADVTLGVQYLVSVALEDPDTEIREAAIDMLGSLALVFPGIIRKHVLPRFIRILPASSKMNQGSGSVDEDHLLSPEYVLYALARIGVEPTLSELVVPQVLINIDSICTGKTQFTSAEILYTMALLEAIVRLLRAKATLRHADIPGYLDHLVPHLLGMSIYPTVNEADSSSHPMTSKEALETIAEIIRIVMVQSNASEQNTFVNAIFHLFALGNLSILATYKPEYEQIPFTPLHSDSRLSQQNTALLFGVVVETCRQETTLAVDNLQEFTATMAEMALRTSNPTQQLAMVRAVATIFNKYNKRDALEPLLSKTLMPRLHEILISRQRENTAPTPTPASTPPVISSESALLMYIWITKALVLSAHALSLTLLDELLTLFSDRALGTIAANGFGVIAGDQPGILNKETFAVVRPLHKQRFVNHCVPLMLNGVQMPGEETPTRCNFLIALSHLLQNSSKQVLQAELATTHFLPVLLRSLSSNPGEIFASLALGTVFNLSCGSPELVKEHLPALVPLLLQFMCLDHEGINPIQIRVDALKCLSLLPTIISWKELEPYYAQVDKELSRVLDDHKRMVRREAVECRDQWSKIA